MILMRHGQSEFNVIYGRTRVDPGLRDPGLTDLGREQVAASARALAENRVGRTVRRILASPYRRALQTAGIVAETLGLPVEIDPTVGERAAFTCDIGTPRSELCRHWPDIRFDHVAEEWWPTPVESVAALELRGLRFRGGAGRRADWTETLVVSHWGFIRALTGHPLPNAAMVLFDPTAAAPGGTVVDLGDPC